MYDIRLEKVKRSDPRYQAIRDRHYIPNRGSVGQQIHYLIFIGGGLSGIISGGSAAYAVKTRDDYFGINKENRQVALNGIIDNTVFRLENNLPNAGTQILAKWRRQISIDWEAKYGVKVAGFETFVIENERRKGSVYLADNWQYVGETAGNTKFHLHGINKSMERTQTEKKLIFCKRIKGATLPTEYMPTWNLRHGITKGQFSLFDESYEYRIGG